MKWKNALRTWHRRMALIVSLQLLAWSIGGFMFSILDIDNVHGDWERNFDPSPSIDVSAISLTPGAALARAVEGGVAAAAVARVSLRTRRDGRTVYELYDGERLAIAAVDASSGEVVQRISPEQAVAAALLDFTPTASALSVRLLTDEPPLEYRGQRLPAYQVLLDHPKQTHVYVCAVTGKVTVRRNRPWRVFDFFWMLHIMDYGGREDFNHWLLSGASVLAILTSASGLGLWGLRWTRRWPPASRAAA